MAKSLEFVGFAEAAQVLGSLEKRVGNRVMTQVLRKNAGILVAEEKRLSSNADVTGETTRSIGILVGRNAGSVSEAVVGPRRGNGFKGYHAHFQEYGTAPHAIQPKKGKYLSFNGRLIRKVNHPGMAAQPFIRPAIVNALPRAQAGIKTDLRAILDNNFQDVNFS
jgi:HK97 gp10 family phage protein